MNSFGKSLLGATGALSLVLVGILVSRPGPNSAETAPGSGPSLQDSGRKPTPSGASLSGSAPKLPTSARELVPKHAWLIVDFDTSLTERRPFEDSPDPTCQKVPAPKRAALGLLPPEGEASEPEVILAASGVSREFLQCARQRILGSGGAEANLAPGLDLLKSRTGLLLHEQKGDVGNVVFVTGKPKPELLIHALLGDAAPHVPPTNAHSSAADADSLAFLTLVLPPDWLASAGDEGRASPLRYLRGGTASLTPSGKLHSTLECEPEGCAALRAFAERALRDLERDGSFRLLGSQWSKNTGQIELSLNKRAGWSPLVSRFLPPSLSAPSPRGTDKPEARPSP
jgi:hypothetical protein